VSGLGDTLRGARERRGETIAAAADAIGAEVAHLEALETERLGDLPDELDRPGLVGRYARHLELDPAWLAAELALLENHDPDADTQPIRLPAAPPAKRDSALIWVGAGVVLGIGALVLLGGGLRSDSSTPTSAAAPAVATARTPTSTTRSPATAPTTTPLDAPAPQVLQPKPADTPAIDLRLGARAGKTVWVEVRRGGVSGPQIYAGTVGGAATKRFRSSTPLWLGVAWAPNVTVSVNDEVIDAEGGTESYIVTQRGLRRLTSQ
jgi:cytoskeleton protein RodZ